MNTASIRDKAPIVLGLTFLWPLFQASPYFPVSLALNSNTAEVARITGYHSVYILLFCILAALVLAQPARTVVRLARLRSSGLVAGILGSLGCGLLMASHDLGSWGANIALGCGMTLVALFVVFAVVSWGWQAGANGFKGAVISIAASYVAASVLWLGWVLGGLLAGYLLAACPLISGLCLSLAAQHSDGRERSAAPQTAQSPVPLAILWPCVVIVYAAVLLVRALTTMQAGLSVGSLNASQQAVSAAIQVVISLIFAATLAAMRMHTPAKRTVAVFGVLVMLFLAALLQVVLTGNAQESSFLGRRSLVGLEHCFELLIFMGLAYNYAQRPEGSARAFALFAIIVLAIPQFLSLDLLYRVGVMDLLSGVDLVVPIAAIASFFVAAPLVGLLTTTVAPYERTGSSPAEPAAPGDATPTNWQEELCRKTIAGLDVSSREFDVMLLAYRGYSARNIAQQLAVSESTVKTHLTHLYRKLGIHSRQELIARIDSNRS